MFKTRLLVWICLIALSPMKQMLGVGQLVAHYVEHKKVDANMGVVEFLLRHYASEDHEKDGHSKKDHQLPFMQLDNNFHVLKHTLLVTENGLVQSQVETKQTEYLHFVAHSLSGVEFDIWQPPRAI